MSRIPLSFVVVSSALVVACGVTPEREYGALGGSSSAADDDEGGDELDSADDHGTDDGTLDDGDDTGVDDDEGGGGGGDSEPEPADDDGGDAGGGGGPTTTVAFPVPRMTCPAASCMSGGEGGGKELEGRDLVREAFYSVAGFPDGATYATHINPEAHAPPYGGYVGRAVEAIAVVNSLVLEAGIGSCDELPVQGNARLASMPGVTLAYAAGQAVPPLGYAGQGEPFQKSVTMTDASGAAAIVEATCGQLRGYASLQLVESPGVFGRIQLYWDNTDQSEHKLELIAYSKTTDERVAIRFATDAEEYGVWFARARAGESPTRHAGLRAYVRADAIDQQATAFVQQLPEQRELYRVAAASAAGLAPVSGSSLMCADFAADDPNDGTGSPCAALPLDTTAAPTFDDDGAFSIEWVALPAGQGGLIDAFEPL